MDATTSRATPVNQVKSASPLYAGIDFGTSGCRIIVIDDDKNIVTQHRVALPPAELWRGHQAQDPMIWRQGLLELFSAIKEKIDLDRLAALAIDGTSGTVLLTDAQGNSCSPALMYHDQAPSHAERIARYAPPESAARGASSGLAKILFLLEQNEANNATAFHTQADWLSYLLTGTAKLTDENNALKLGYDPVNRAWPDWIATLAPRLPPMFPTCIPPGQFYGLAQSDFSKSLGLNAQTRIIAGTTDSNAAVLATGVSQIGDAVTSLGSTLVVKILSDTPIFAPQFGVYSHRLGNRWLVGGASNAGGACLLQHFSIEEMDSLTPQLQPDQPTGLDYYPLPKIGERFPTSDPNMMPRLSPIPKQPAVFFQGMLEGLAAIEYESYRKLAQLGANYPKRVVTCGGGARNPAWQQIRANRLGVPVTKAEQDEAAYGSALLAMSA